MACLLAVQGCDVRSRAHSAATAHARTVCSMGHAKLVLCLSLCMLRLGLCLGVELLCVHVLRILRSVLRRAIGPRVRERACPWLLLLLLTRHPRVLRARHAIRGSRRVVRSKGAARHEAGPGWVVPAGGPLRRGGRHLLGHGKGGAVGAHASVRCAVLRGGRAGEDGGVGEVAQEAAHALVGAGLKVGEEVHGGVALVAAREGVVLARGEGRHVARVLEQHVGGSKHGPLHARKVLRAGSRRAVSTHDRGAAAEQQAGTAAAQRQRDRRTHQRRGGSATGGRTSWNSRSTGLLYADPSM